jgi:hypothetical protein
VLIRRRACHQVEVLVVVGRHPVSGFPVASRVFGGRHLRREQFKR